MIDSRAWLVHSGAMVLPRAYGLTGGICSGKSTVASIFLKLGVPIISADDISRKLCQQGEPVWVQIKEAFGGDVFKGDDTLDRKKLADVVFKDPKKRKQLEQIQHPPIMKEIQGQIKKFFDEGQPLVLVEAALIVEAGYLKDFNGLIVVDCKPKQQLERLCKRENIDQHKASTIIQAQMPLDEKIKKATFVIDNSGSLQQTQKNAEEVFEKIRAKKERTLPQWH